MLSLCQDFFHFAILLHSLNYSIYNTCIILCEECAHTDMIKVNCINLILDSRDLASNKIDSLEGNPFRGLSLLHDLLLCHNAIQAVPEDAFHGLPAVQLL
jgi:hypothetical protein